MRYTESEFSKEMQLKANLLYEIEEFYNNIGKSSIAEINDKFLEYQSKNIDLENMVLLFRELNASFEKNMYESENNNSLRR